MKKIAILASIIASALVVVSCASKTADVAPAPVAQTAPAGHHHHHHDLKGEMK